MRELSRAIRKLAMVPLAGFLALCLLCGWWQVVRAVRLQADPNNKRTLERPRRVIPGEVYSSDGELVLGAQEEHGKWVRTYPIAEAFCHLTGYNDRSGLTPGLLDALTGQGCYADPWDDLTYGRPVGCDVVLTINARAQRLATRLLRGQRGAVIALDAQTGAILCMASAPTYDPRNVTQSTELFEVFRNDPASPELFRPIQGLYPPGSVLTILTAAATLDAGIVKPDTNFTCGGVEWIAGSQVRCRHSNGYGQLSLTRALADSCNIAFAKLGQQLGPKRFADYVARFHLLDAPKLPFGEGVVQAGRMAEFVGDNAEAELVQTAFGQGKTLVTPYAIAVLTLAIAREGRQLAPYLIEEVHTKRGKVLKRGGATSLGQAVSRQAASDVAGMMVECVETGTGGRLAVQEVSVAGKTGSAQNPQGVPHAWATAFAPAQSPRVVVTVIVENAGAGGVVAAPIVQQVMALLLNK